MAPGRRGRRASERVEPSYDHRSATNQPPSLPSERIRMVASPAQVTGLPLPAGAIAVRTVHRVAGKQTYPDHAIVALQAQQPLGSPPHNAVADFRMREVDACMIQGHYPALRKPLDNAVHNDGGHPLPHALYAAQGCSADLTWACPSGHQVLSQICGDKSAHMASKRYSASLPSGLRCTAPFSMGWHVAHRVMQVWQAR